MTKKMEVDQFAEFSSAVTRSLPRDLDTTTAQSWILNQDALTKVLREALVPPEKQSANLANTFLTVNRSKLFTPAEFIGKGWTIWRGPADGDGLSGAEEQDERSLAITHVNLADILLETTLKPSDNGRVQGEKKLRRLKAEGLIRLDAMVFQALWENKSLIPESWKTKNAVYFDGTILRGPDGRRCVLCLCWRGGGCLWRYDWLVHDWRAVSPSAVSAVRPK